MNVHVTVSMDPEQLRLFDEWWKANDFKSRSEALVYLMRRAPTDGRTAKEEDDPYGS